MPIPVTCPGCAAAFQARDDSAGNAVFCPKCQRPVPVPLTEIQLLASIRAACWTVAGVLIAMAALGLVAWVISMVSRPSSGF